MSDVITTYDGLVDALRSLPAVADGRTRVFRGQNRDYATMTPTALRGAGGEDMLWPSYARLVAKAMREPPGGGVDWVEADPVSAAAALELMVLWVRAIKQHYGPGTEFLDVTHSVGIAAWFALHRLEPVEARARYAMRGPNDPRTDVVGEHTFFRHVPVDEPAVIYALDAVAGSGLQDLDEHGTLIEHGTLFDLALGPSAFSSSTRIRVQQACLVYADPAVDGGDLAPLIVSGTPLRIAWPLDGCPEARRSTNEVFPPAANDDWYARFVALPLAPDLEASRAETVFGHPIKVALYLPTGEGEEEDRVAFQDLTGRFVTQGPPLLYPMLLAEGVDPYQDLPGATALYLEGPFLSSQLPTSAINVPMLVYGLAGSAPVADYVTGDPAGEATLKNVFIEISALDETDWATLERDRPAVSIIRALWLIREQDWFTLTTFWHDIASDDHTMLGPVEIMFDRAAASFTARGMKAGAPWRPLRELPDLERDFVTALSLVHSLSPGWKISAAPFTIIGDETGGDVTNMVALEWAHAELLTLAALGGPISLYHVLRRWGVDAPFYGVVDLDFPSRGESVFLEGRPFAKMTPSQILKKIAPLLAAKEKTPPPLPNWHDVRQFTEGPGKSVSD